MYGGPLGDNSSLLTSARGVGLGTHEFSPYCNLNSAYFVVSSVEERREEDDEADDEYNKREDHQA
eukprot:SAG11_NODE_108_length_16386_cov_20.828329_3_plen_65_part_00